MIIEPKLTRSKTDKKTEQRIGLSRKRSVWNWSCEEVVCNHCSCLKYTLIKFFWYHAVNKRFIASDWSNNAVVSRITVSDRSNPSDINIIRSIASNWSNRAAVSRIIVSDRSNPSDVNMLNSSDRCLNHAVNSIIASAW